MVAFRNVTTVTSKCNGCIQTHNIFTIRMGYLILKPFLLFNKNINIKEL